MDLYEANRVLPSLHDWLLVAYEVKCEERRIAIFARHWSTSDSSIDCTIEFMGVEAYRLKNDAFGNIVFSWLEVSAEKILLDYRSEIEESYKWAGAPGPWAADCSTADAILGARGIKGFVLSSSYGLSGWLLAKE